MAAHLKYLHYLIRHKWFVFVAGLQTNAPLWRLIIHDWSKFLPCEWNPYVNYFYGHGSRLRPCHNPLCERKKHGALAFDRAWLHHQHANSHHWQHWILRNDDGSVRELEIPQHFVQEMVADWMGAGRAITGKWEALAWYEKNKAKIALHPNSRILTEELLKITARVQ